MESLLGAYLVVMLAAFIASIIAAGHDLWDGAAIAVLWPIYGTWQIAKAARRVFTS